MHTRCRIPPDNCAGYARERLEPHERQRMIDSFAHFVFLHACAARSKGRVVEHVEPWKARILLKHDGDAVQHLSSDRAAFELHRAAARGVDAREHVQQGRFTAAGRPDHREELARFQVEAHRPERVKRRLAGHVRVDARDIGQTRLHAWRVGLRGIARDDGDAETTWQHAHRGLTSSFGDRRATRTRR